MIASTVLTAYTDSSGTYHEEITAHSFPAGQEARKHTLLMHRHERNKKNTIDLKEKRHCGKILAIIIRSFHPKNTLSDAQRAMTAFFIIIIIFINISTSY